MSKIQNVVYDLGGVLVDLDPPRCQAAFRALGMDAVAELVDPCYPAEMIGMLERGAISFAEACERMRRLAHAPEVTDEQIAQAYGAFLVGIPVEKLRQIDRLRARGVRTYVLSNNNPVSMEFVRRMFRADGKTMEDYFDGVYLSYELRALKPSPEAFRRMLDAAGIDPAETLMIDDGLRNVEAARALGMSVYMPAPKEDFGYVLETLDLYEEND